MTDIIVTVIATLGSVLVAMIAAGIIARPAIKRNQETAAKVDSIDRQLNNAPKGAPTLISTVHRMGELVDRQERRHAIEIGHAVRHRQWIEECVGGICEHVGYDAPKPPKVPDQLKGDP